MAQKLDKATVMAKKAHKLWAKSIAVGSLVEDCRFQVHKVTELSTKYSMPGWIYRLIIFLPFPDKIVFGITTWAEKFCLKFGIKKWIDATVTLDDGQRCSLIHCCAPAPTLPKDQPERLVSYLPGNETLH